MTPNSVTPAKADESSRPSSPSSSSPSKENDYLVKFGPIQCADQHAEYQRVFEKEYKEYQGISDRIQAVAAKAKELDRQLEGLLRLGSTFSVSP